jgi:tetratricopeptide (TPR) repeat protein
MPTINSDFHLIITRNQVGAQSGEPHRYHARVVTSPVGQASGDFVLPFRQEDIRRLSWRAGFSLRDIALIKSPESSAAPALTLEEFGATLFDAVFAGDVGQLFFRSVDAAERAKQNLRLRLQFDSDAGTEGAEIAELPWECLYSRELDRFLALSTLTPLVRYVALAQPERTLAVTLPLRILVIVSNPSDLPRLDVEQEWARLNDGVRELVDLGLVVVERLEAATLTALRQHLRREQTHILHFIGHGFLEQSEVDPTLEEGALLFENEVGHSVSVSAKEMATLLHDHDALRLVFLNACHGASSDSQNFFAGVAQKLVQQGVPTVLAMQFAVSDAAAIALAHEFYQSLADGLPLESAVSEARKAIYSEGNEFEWATPVLFSRSPNGEILALDEEGGESGKGARNVVIGKNNIQINIGGRLMTLPFWLIVFALLALVVILSLPFLEPLFFPSQMTAGMNIAITDFGQIDEQGRISRSALGSALSKTVFDKLNLEYQEVYPELIGKDGRSVEIWHDSQGRDVKNVPLGLLTGATPEARAEQAKALAAKINAHVVIYGYLVEEGNQNSLHLDFYYAGDTLRGEPDTVVGRHVLSELISFPTALEQEPMAVQEFLNEPLGLRARVLFWVTVALIFDVTDQQERALQTLQEAERTLADWEDSDGQALLHYFIGREAFWLREYDVAIAALEEAIRLKPNYANAYIGLGVVHYDRAQLFYTPQPIPAELVDCITVEHLDRAAQTVDDAVADIDLSIDYLQQAVAIAPTSPWPPIEFPARLALGHAYRLKGQAYLLGAQHELGQAWFVKSLEEFDLAQQAFDEAEQQQYLSWTHLGKAATYQLQAYSSLVDVRAEDDEATVTQKQQAAATLFQQADEECQRCLDEGKDVADLVYQRKVLRCGCEYLQGIAQAAHAEVQKLMEEQ